MRKKESKKYRTLIKIIVCIIHIVVIAILGFCSFEVYQRGDAAKNFSEIKRENKYVYLDISEMSDAIAKIDKGNKKVHIVIEKTDSGKWYTYLIAIKAKDEKKYKSLIDYSETETNKVPKKIRVYGYTKKINNDIKKKVIKNSTTLSTKKEGNVITNKNFEKYLTDLYLDTTVKKHHEFNYVMLILLLMLVILTITLILVIFDKDKIVDEVDKITEESIKKITKKEEKENRKNVKRVKKALKKERKKNKK